MESGKPAFQKYLFVCENERPDGVCCMPQGAQIRQTLKDLVKSQGLSKSIRVSRAGCLDTCADGPNVLLMPDYIWFKKVSSADAHVILETVKGKLA